jgi:hypothetical protein
MRGTWNMLANGGPITWTSKADSDGVGNGYWYGPLSYWGSKAASLVPTSSSNISIAVDRFDWASGSNPYFASTGTVEVKPASTSFGMTTYSDWFVINQNSQNVGGFTVGKSGNTAALIVGTAITANGPINLYGGDVSINQSMTSNAAGADILVKATGNITQAASTTVKTNGGDITY